MPQRQETAIDLSFRPNTYFWAYDNNIRLPSDIKGAHRKARYERLLEDGENEAAAALMSTPTLSDRDRRLWGQAHPSFMGGEYLPSRLDEEVEIARITIASTTMDVTCVYAKRSRDRIRYRVVDEYDGDTLEKRVRSSIRPLTLLQLTNYFLGTWDLMMCLHINFWEYNYPRDAVQGFVIDASSSFYAQFGDLVRERIDDWLIAKWATLDLDQD